MRLYEIGADALNPSSCKVPARLWIPIGLVPVWNFALGWGAKHFKSPFAVSLSNHERLLLTHLIA